MSPQNRRLHVRVNDRELYVAGRRLDLSQAADEEIGVAAVGTGLFRGDRGGHIIVCESFGARGVTG